MAKELYMLVLVLFSFEGLVQCHESRINLGSKLETFVSWSLDWYKGGHIFVHAIQEDKLIPGNMLAAIGNALYTITSDGYSELLVGSLQDSGFRNGVGTDASFNKTSGILQMDDGKTVVISDYWNGCLRKLDRTTKEVTTFAGRCKEYHIVSGVHVCPPRRDGSLNTATFCNPDRMRYVKSTNKVYLSDMSINQTFIRSIDLSTFHVSTVFSNLTFEARDFMMGGENDDSYIFSVSPGIFKVDTLTAEGTWLAGCGNANYHGKCSTNEGIRRISTRLSHGILSQEGVFVVTDLLGNQVYIVDPENNAFTTLCPSGAQSYCSIRGPASLALIGDYLYIGEAINPNYYYHTINIKRIKISISPQSVYAASTKEWMYREKAELKSATTVAWDLLRPYYHVHGVETTTYKFYGNVYDHTKSYVDSDKGGGDGGLIGGICGGVAFFIFIIAISCFVGRKRPVRFLHVNAQQGVVSNGRSLYNRFQNMPIVDIGMPAAAFTSASEGIIYDHEAANSTTVNVADLNTDVAKPPPYEEERKVGESSPPAYEDGTAAMTSST